ncbi:MAG: uracil-DNA glycosylase family protein [Miltoncostaeaceae bacterium]
MSPDAPTPDPGRRRSRRAAGQSGDEETADDIQSAYERRAIAEMAALNDEITAAAPCRDEDELPVLASGSPQADIMLVKWSPNLAERQEGVAFFGRAGTAILKSMQRLGIDPLTLYGTLCVKCAGEEAAGDGADFLHWLSREVQIVQPALVVVMGERVVDAVNRMDHPMAAALRAEPGQVQSWTPSVDAIYVPDIDDSLDEQSAKRAFWSAFRAIGDWHQAQPPY